MREKVCVIERVCAKINEIFTTKTNIRNQESGIGVAKIPEIGSHKVTFEDSWPSRPFQLVFSLNRW